ncbi:hypothetical protein [Pedobacter sp. NJ-S-72]
MEDKVLSENNWNVEEDTDDVYLKLTSQGRMLFNEVGFMKKHTKTEGPSTINVHIGGNNTGNLVLGSTVNDVINKLSSESQSHSESAALLDTMKKLIQNANNQEAITAFEEFNKE